MKRLFYITMMIFLAVVLPLKGMEKNPVAAAMLKKVPRAAVETGIPGSLPLNHLNSSLALDAIDTGLEAVSIGLSEGIEHVPSHIAEKATGALVGATICSLGKLQKESHQDLVYWGIDAIRRYIKLYLFLHKKQKKGHLKRAQKISVLTQFLCSSLPAMIMQRCAVDLALNLLKKMYPNAINRNGLATFVADQLVRNAAGLSFNELISSKIF